ncbi:MAG: hypothetical protein SGJ10_09335 [Bacteroidota bacterium]|nr:hypothetical protein [Bacteroidota bacterium]
MKIILSTLAVCLVSVSAFSQELASMPGFLESIKAGKHFEPDSAYDQSWFNILDEEAKANKIFFTGENHNYRKINAKLKLQLFKYLHEKAGVNVFIAEMGWCCALLHNKYLQTADSSAWDVISKYTYPSNQEMLKELREYWLAQPDDKKFVMAGVEFDREPEFGIKILTMLIPEGTAPHDSMRFETEALRFMDAYIEKDLVSSHKYEYDETYETVTTEQTERYYNQYLFLKNFVDHYKRWKSSYKTWLGKDFDKWEMAIQSIEEYQKFDDLANLPQGDIYREERMAAELDKIIATNQGNIYGQFGRCHINLQKDKEWCGFYYFRSLAYRMQQKPELANKVLSIPILYMDKADDYKNTEFEIITDYFIETKELLQPGITLIKLEGDDTIINTLKTKYIYIFIYKPYSEFEKQEAEAIVEESIEKAFETVEKKKRWNTTTFGYGITAPFKEPLHDFYNTTGLTTITKPITYYGFASTNINEKKKSKSKVRMSENYVNFISPNRQSIGDTLDVVLKSWQIGSHVGIDLLKKRKHLSLTIGYGILYNQTKLKIYRYSNNLTVVNPGKQPTMTEISNPALMVDALIDLRYMRKGFCIFARSGASYDLSNTHWKANGEILNNTPKTSWSAWYAQGGIGIAIENKKKGVRNILGLLK